LLFLVSLPVGLAACSAGQSSPTSAANLPNPASVYCEQNGGKLEMRDNAAGTAGICKFPDGSECDEWAYYRGECRPGAAAPASEPSATPAPARNATAADVEVAADGWKIYRDAKLGYSFHYPADATISTADDPQHTLTITGGKAEDEYWPNIYVGHPTDREDYLPPAGVDLEKWLTEHNLLMTGGKLGEVRQPDTEIAGTRAIHTRLARSPQTYAYDKYYFAHSQQLYSVVILHVGDKENWNVYNHFLSSIQFTR
ncbi:MAG: DUF333 domain-containing protein, partial [Rudaea sp.]